MYRYSLCSWKRTVRENITRSRHLILERALGVHWCVESDTFGFRILVKDKPLTRRGILSIVSSIYDPLGFAAPFTLTPRSFSKTFAERRDLDGMTSFQIATSDAGRSGGMSCHCSNARASLAVYSHQTSGR